MRKIITLALLAVSGAIFGQNTFPSSGNVGIGTTSPLAKLHVNNGNNSYGSILANANEQNFSLYTKTLTTSPINIESFRLGLKYGNNENNGFISFYRGDSSSGGFLGFSSNGMERLRITRNGNIGINTSAPSANLHINSSSDVGPGQNPALRIGLRSGNHISIDGNEIGAYNNNSYSVLYINGSGSTSNTIINDAGGKVGIGTLNPDSELTVDGKIHCKEVLVDLNIPADYVFQKYYTGFSTLKETYTMPTLEEVEEFTKKNHHLPEMPSAEEMQKEGLELKEMTNLLLQKIEELTLYTIEQEKRIKALEGKLKKKK